MSTTPAVVWFRHDLRLEDHPALHAAARSGRPIVPVFIWAPDEEGDWQPGAVSRWWLHHSLARLDADLRGLGSRLVVRVGESLAVLRDLARETGAGAVFWNRRYEPAAIARDTAVKSALKADGLTVVSFNGTLLHEPWTLPTPDEGPLQVFSDFWRACQAADPPPEPLPAPPRLTPPSCWPTTLAVSDLGLLPGTDRAAGLRATWRPGTAGAAAQLARFAEEALGRYAAERDRPDLDAGSRLSPHLRFGEVSVRRVWQTVRDAAGPRPSPALRRNLARFRQELGWREFSYYLLFHFPHAPDTPLRPEFARLGYRKDPAQLRAWQEGRTGYPLVDAGMRELQATGWMHNRVRMVTASFLVKHLLLDWRQGTRWFWEMLADADLAGNTFGWQWTAGTGVDAAPYFRIFNPALQARQFDPLGVYVRRWLPELARLPDEHLAAPCAAPGPVLRAAGVTPGASYPFPLIDHAIARSRALDAYEALAGPGRRS
jgi:deoxyribodipyrimidine photo-lyase